jgi:hypothetical protein
MVLTVVMMVIHWAYYEIDVESCDGQLRVRECFIRRLGVLCMHSFVRWWMETGPLHSDNY